MQVAARQQGVGLRLVVAGEAEGHLGDRQAEQADRAGALRTKRNLDARRSVDHGGAPAIRPQLWPTIRDGSREIASQYRNRLP